MESGLKIIEFNKEPQYVKKFISLPYRLYKDDAKWMPPPENDLAGFLNGSHPYNSFLLHRNFLLEQSGRIIGRATAFVNRLLIIEGKPVGSIGNFECEDNQDAAVLLIDKAYEWLKKQNVAVIWAPMNGTIWYTYRFMTRGFEDIPFLKEPYNKPYYPAIFEQAGFRVLKKWYSGVVLKPSIDEFLGRTEKIYHYLLKKGYQFRKLNLDLFDDELSLLYKLIFDAYSYFTGFHQLSREIFVEVFQNLKSILLPDLAFFAINPAGETVGFCISLPNFQNMLWLPENGFDTTAEEQKRNQQLLSTSLIYLGVIQTETKKNNGLGGALEYLAVSAARQLNVPVIFALVAEDSLALFLLKYTTRNSHEYCLYYKEI